jgi:hypothetical protein
VQLRAHLVSGRCEPFMQLMKPHLNVQQKLHNKVKPKREFAPRAGHPGFAQVHDFDHASSLFDSGSLVDSMDLLRNMMRGNNYDQHLQNHGQNYQCSIGHALVHKTVSKYPNSCFCDECGN